MRTAELIDHDTKYLKQELEKLKLKYDYLLTNYFPYGGNYFYEAPTIENYLISLTNFINATVLYDECNYLKIGKEKAWEEYKGFSKKVKAEYRPVDFFDYPELSEINLLFKQGRYLSKLNTHSPELSLPLEETSDEKLDPYNLYSVVEKDRQAYRDPSLEFYLTVSKTLNSDIYVSPERASKINSKSKHFQINNTFLDYLREIDKKIENETESLWLEKHYCGVKENFLLPSLTHYVLSQSSSQNDLLDVIFQIKSSGEMIDFKHKLLDIKSVKEASKFQNEIIRIVESAFGKSSTKMSWSMNVNVLFLSFGKSFGIGSLFQKSYLSFLKDVITCRTEINGLKKDFERVFNCKDIL